jgi:hypothetical protein
MRGADPAETASSKVCSHSAVNKCHRICRTHSSNHMSESRARDLGTPIQFIVRGTRSGACAASERRVFRALTPRSAHRDIPVNPPHQGAQLVSVLPSGGPDCSDLSRLTARARVIHAIVSPRSNDLSETRLGGVAQSILVIDDTPAVIGMLIATLSEAGYRVRSATDGESALEQALRKPSGRAHGGA